MPNQYSTIDLLNFLDHAGERGLMPAATATALTVAVRNVFGVLSDEEAADVRSVDLDAVLQRFQNKRAHDFTPASLRAYGSRVRRAVDLFIDWRNNPANFTVKTRSTAATRRRESSSDREQPMSADGSSQAIPAPPVGSSPAGTYQTAFLLRQGLVVTLLNIPTDLTPAEAKRLAQFVEMLALQ